MTPRPPLPCFGQAGKSAGRSPPAASPKERAAALGLLWPRHGPQGPPLMGAPVCSAALVAAGLVGPKILGPARREGRARQAGAKRPANVTAMPTASPSCKSNRLRGQDPGIGTTTRRTAPDMLAPSPRSSKQRTRVSFSSPRRKRASNEGGQRGTQDCPRNMHGPPRRGSPGECRPTSPNAASLNASNLSPKRKKPAASEQRNPTAAPSPRFRHDGSNRD